MSKGPESRLPVRRRLQWRQQLSFPDFGKDDGVRIADSALAGLFTGAVAVPDEEGKVIYKRLDIIEIQLAESVTD
ncbi:MAG: hypothetical protein D3906_14575 [Candidatus Electrothrix sp. AUS1_2]|nr:hypothetical protein [Candidatus Electrothrix sp. AUS1_2]